MLLEKYHIGFRSPPTMFVSSLWKPLEIPDRGTTTLPGGEAQDDAEGTGAEAVLHITLGQNLSELRLSLEESSVLTPAAFEPENVIVRGKDSSAGWRATAERGARTVYGRRSSCATECHSRRQDASWSCRLSGIRFGSSAALH